MSKEYCDSILEGLVEVHLKAGCVKNINELKCNSKGATLCFQVIFPRIINRFGPGYSFSAKVKEAEIFIDLGHNDYSTVGDSSYFLDKKSRKIKSNIELSNTEVKLAASTVFYKIVKIISFSKFGDKPGWIFTNLHLVDDEASKWLELKIDKLNGCCTSRFLSIIDPCNIVLENRFVSKRILKRRKKSDFELNRYKFKLLRDRIVNKEILESECNVKLTSETWIKTNKGECLCQM